MADNGSRYPHPSSTPLASLSPFDDRPRQQWLEYRSVSDTFPELTVCAGINQPDNLSLLLLFIPVPSPPPPASLCSVKVFNVGQLRRAKARQAYLKTGQKSKHDASFFDNSNASAAKDREALAEECLENLITWLKEGGGNVGIHDATNSNIARRKKLSDRIAREPGLKIVFLESICTDPEVIAHNIAVKVSSGDPDYDGMDPKDAERDFRARIKTYEENYQELGSTKAEEKLSYCKIMWV